MARIAGKITEQTVQDMKRAATRLIARHGFEGMNLRQLAQATGLKAGSFYNHITSKEELLYTLLAGTMDELHLGLDAALQGVQDPADALARFVAFHIGFHAERRDEVFIGNAELRSLSAEHRVAIVARRDAYEERLRTILRQGLRQGCFGDVDARVAAAALIAMLSGVCTWYRADGRLRVPALVRQYTRLALGAVGAKASTGPAGTRARPGPGLGTPRPRP